MPGGAQCNVSMGKVRGTTNKKGKEQPMATDEMGTNDAPHFKQVDGAWRVEGPVDLLKPLKVVEVTKRNGQTTHVFILEVEEEHDGVAVAKFSYPGRWTRVETDADDYPVVWAVRLPAELAAIAEEEPVPVLKRDGTIERVVVDDHLLGPDQRGEYLGRVIYKVREVHLRAGGA